jgi:endonuclease I
MKKIFILLFWSIAFALVAQIPAGYYDQAEGKTGADLKTALFNIVGAHTQITYTGLWAAFQYTDARADGKVWDIYSSATNYVFGYSSNGGNQCGNYSKEGDCYNREHSFPKSWFNISSGQEDSAPMGTDLFHLYPSDGYVNAQRSNYMFGEVASPTYTSKNGYCKLGPCSFPGYTGTVFEPGDDMKGDFARTYFYMVTAYQDRIVTWTNSGAAQLLDVTSSTTLTYPSFKQWAINLLLKWNAQDPVSQKEINRNNVIYTQYQHNRNPFIDHPELAEYIWGDKKGMAWSSTVSSGIHAVELNDLQIIVLREERVIRFESENQRTLQYNVTDISGKTLMSGHVEISQSVSLGALPKGIYIIHVSDGKGIKVTKFLL